MLPPPASTKPKTPIAFARSAGSVNRVMISESATAETTAPPRPCTARAATSRPCVVDEAAGDRGQREERDADQEQPPVAEEVAEPAAEQQEAAEGQQVGVHDPGQRRLARSRGPPGSTAARRSRSSCRARSSGRPGRGRCSASQRVRSVHGHELSFLSIGVRLSVGPARCAELIGQPAAMSLAPPERSVLVHGMAPPEHDRLRRGRRSLQTRPRSTRSRGFSSPRGGSAARSGCATHRASCWS